LTPCFFVGFQPFLVYGLVPYLPHTAQGKQWYINLIAANSSKMFMGNIKAMHLGGIKIEDISWSPTMNIFL
jgi:hypothetical protein